MSPKYADLPRSLLIAARLSEDPLHSWQSGDRRLESLHVRMAVQDAAVLCALTKRCIAEVCFLESVPNAQSFASLLNRCVTCRVKKLNKGLTLTRGKQAASPRKSERAVAALAPGDVRPAKH